MYENIGMFPVFTDDQIKKCLLENYNIFPFVQNIKHF